MQNNIEPFEAGAFFHVYNRANGSERLFFQERNYYYFFDLFHREPAKFVNLAAYCLIPNHFHMLVRVKETVDNKEVSEAFRKTFISYSQAINKQQGRKGSLFMRPLKRKMVTSDEYIRNIIVYIHRNPVTHGLTSSLESYRWSSYYDALNGKLNSFAMQLFADLFGEASSFVFAHQGEAEMTSLPQPKTRQGMSSLSTPNPKNQTR